MEDLRPLCSLTERPEEAGKDCQSSNPLTYTRCCGDKVYFFKTNVLIYGS